MSHVRCKLQFALGVVALVLATGCKEERALPDRVEIKMTGSAYCWEIRGSGGDGEIGTADDVVTSRRLQLPIGVPVRISLRSGDFIYGVTLTDFEVTGIAVPGLDHSVEFVPSELGEFQLRGNQMCGFSHPNLIVTVEVVGVEAFTKTLNDS